jgi:hypothetical protein
MRTSTRAVIPSAGAVIPSAARNLARCAHGPDSSVAALTRSDGFGAALTRNDGPRAALPRNDGRLAAMLLEVIIAMTIMTATFGILSAELIAGIRMTSYADEQTRANELANRVMFLIELDQQTQQRIFGSQENSDEFLPQYPDWFWRVTMLPSGDTDGLAVITLQILHNETKGGGIGDARPVRALHLLKADPGKIDLTKDFGFTEDQINELASSGVMGTMDPTQIDVQALVTLLTQGDPTQIQGVIGLLQQLATMAGTAGQGQMGQLAQLLNQGGEGLPDALRQLGGQGLPDGAGDLAQQLGGMGGMPPGGGPGRRPGGPGGQGGQGGPGGRGGQGGDDQNGGGFGGQGGFNPGGGQQGGGNRGGNQGGQGNGGNRGGGQGNGGNRGGGQGNGGQGGGGNRGGQSGGGNNGGNNNGRRTITDFQQQRDGRGR